MSFFHGCSDYDLSELGQKLVIGVPQLLKLFLQHSSVVMEILCAKLLHVIQLFMMKKPLYDLQIFMYVQDLLVVGV